MEMCDLADGSGRASVLRCKNGASAAEFALVLPLLLTLLFGILQVGMLMYSYNLMVSTARDMARAMAVCSITSVTEARTRALANLPPWVARTDWTVTPLIAGTDVSMLISVDSVKAAVVSYLPITLGKLTTTIKMRKEPLAFSATPC